VGVQGHEQFTGLDHFNVQNYVFNRPRSCDPYLAIMWRYQCCGIWQADGSGWTIASPSEDDDKKMGQKFVGEAHSVECCRNFLADCVG